MKHNRFPYMDERKNKDGTRKHDDEYYCMGCKRKGKNGVLLETTSGNSLFFHSKKCLTKQINCVKKYGFDKSPDYIKMFGSFDDRANRLLSMFDNKTFLRVIGKPKMMR